MLNFLTVVALASLQSSVSGRITLGSGKAATEAVVVFEGSDRSKPLAKAIVDQRDRTFIPHVSVVPVGTRIEFPNNDTVFHNVFTEFHSSRFDLGMYPKGTSKFRQFDKPGLAVIMCSVHPDMSAYIMVVDTPYYAVTDKAGKYLIKSLPSGHYKVQVWHESGAKCSLEKDIAASDHLDISIKR